MNTFVCYDKISLSHKSIFNEFSSFTFNNLCIFKIYSFHNVLFPKNKDICNNPHSLDNGSLLQSKKHGIKGNVGM